MIAAFVFANQMIKILRIFISKSFILESQNLPETIFGITLASMKWRKKVNR